MKGGDFQYVPYFFGIFAAVFFGSLSRLKRTLANKDDRALVSSCIASLTHGVPAGIIAGWQVYAAYPIRIEAQNKDKQSFLLQYTLAYMLADTLLYLIPYTPTDFLFCVHHLVVIIYIFTAIYSGTGAISCIIMLFLGECTSFWQNSWYICKTFRNQSQFARRCSSILNVVYPGAYLLARTIVGPPAVLWICNSLWRAKQIPRQFKWLWISICLISLAGSQLWSYNLVKDLRKRPKQAAEPLADKIS